MYDLSPVFICGENAGNWVNRVLIPVPSSTPFPNYNLVLTWVIFQFFFSSSSSSSLSPKKLYNLRATFNTNLSCLLLEIYYLVQSFSFTVKQLSAGLKIF